MQRRPGRCYGHLSWVQLRDIEQTYAALDIGPVAVVDLTLLPQLWQDLSTIFNKGALTGSPLADMMLSDTLFPTLILRLGKQRGRAV